MSSTTKGIITVLTVGVVGYAAYYFLLMDKKGFYAKRIVEAGKSSNAETLKTFDQDFLKAWYTAAKRGEETFSVRGKTYSTQGGKAK